MVLKNHPEGIALRVRVMPRSRRTALAGLRGDSLVVKLTAPPVDGAANSALLDFLAEVLGIPISAVKIATGANSRDKTLVISRIDVASAAARLGLPAVPQE